MSLIRFSDADCIVPVGDLTRPKWYMEIYERGNLCFCAVDEADYKMVIKSKKQIYTFIVQGQAVRKYINELMFIKGIMIVEVFGISSDRYAWGFVECE